MINKQKLLEAIRGQVLTFNALARKLHVSHNQNRQLSDLLLKLVKECQIFTTTDKRYYMPQSRKNVVGIIRINNRGFGFVDLENESIFINSFAVGDALDQDEVSVSSFADPLRKDKKQGIVLKVLNRKHKSFVGRIIKGYGGLTIKPKNMRLKAKFAFSDLNMVKLDYEVIVDITKVDKGIVWIRVKKVLGHKDDVSIDILAAIEDAKVPHIFKEKTLKEAEKIPPTIANEDFSSRQDLREEFAITIDGDDTKDFDDAVSIFKKSDGNFQLKVHIADVSHYVKEDSELDKEARARGTSIYLADRVIPMLPPALSNGICSLKPHQDRFTLTAEIIINQNGENVSHELYASIINSKRRLTYKEVNSFFEDKEKFSNPKLSTMLADALELAKIIRKFKKSEGYIDFEIGESKLVIDDKGKTVDIVPRVRAEAEMLIEDFMVRANEVVAKHASDAKVPFIYRIHDKPETERLVSLQNVIKALRIPNVKVPTVANPKSFAKAIDQLKESRFDDFMKIMMLRTMAKAIYAQKNIGHFGLASEHYTHFTSPIRRYPDLMVHRMLREYFFKNNRQKSKHYQSILDTIATTSSESEQKAVDLEREVDDIKKAEFYERYVGKAFEGQIVSILKFGFFVEFPNKVNGLVHISTLKEGFFKLSDDGFSVESQNKKYTIGDLVTVVVESVDKDAGKINLVIKS